MVKRKDFLTLSNNTLNKDHTETQHINTYLKHIECFLLQLGNYNMYTYSLIFLSLCKSMLHVIEINLNMLNRY